VASLVDGVFEQFGLFFDRAQAVLDGIVGGAEVGCHRADIDLESGVLVIICSWKEVFRGGV
jgi:hypothetical protein